LTFERSFDTHGSTKRRQEGDSILLKRFHFVDSPHRSQEGFLIPEKGVGAMASCAEENGRHPALSPGKDEKRFDNENIC
jgi:hypothetical protein